MAQKLTKADYLKRAKDYAISRGGECLSEEYVAAKAKMSWKCEIKEHPIWLATPDSVVSKKSWCILCSWEKNAKNLVIKDRLMKAQQHAKKKGGLCLSREYLNAKTKMLWKCSEPNHATWLSDYDNTVSRDRWCKKCGYGKAIIKDGYQQAKAYAESKNGKCLSPPDIIVKSHAYLIWQCDKGHEEWRSLFRNVVENKGWCPKCAGKFTPAEYIQKAKLLAVEKGGECISNEYKNQSSILEWQCKNKEHPRFFTTYDNVIKKNCWCNLCKDKLKNPHKIKMLENAKVHAKTKGGECISNIYVNVTEKLKWKCDKGHIWLANYNNIVGVSNRWCPKCAGQLSPREMLKRACDYATSRGGKCLSTTYIKANEKLLWKCSDISHKPWKAVISIDSTNSWCPECGNSIYYKENNARIILEYLLGCKFPKSYEIWNINPKTKKKLELDGYNPDIKIAFEFQGRHHFQPNIFKNQNLEDIQFKDKIKKENCKINGVLLIEIIDKKSMKTIDNIIDHIIELLDFNNINYNKNYVKKDLMKKINDFNSTSVKNERLKLAKDYAISRNGVCLSDSYINYDTKLIWKCSNLAHPIWRSDYGVIKNKSWCKLCAYERNKL